MKKNVRQNMNPNKKRITLGILLVCFLAGAAGMVMFQNPKTSAIRYVRANQAALQQFSEKLLQDPPVNRRTSYNGWTADAYTEMVQFHTSSQGKNYQGFYYSPQNIPLGFQEADMEFIPQENGWYWEESDGNNRMYTEKITDHWYWYDMHF